MVTGEDIAKVELKTATDDLKTAVDAFLAGREKEAIDASQKRIIDAAEKILLTVKPPGHWQWMERVRQMGVIGVTHLFQEWGAFDHIPAEGTISFGELGQKLDAETSLVGSSGGTALHTHPTLVSSFVVTHMAWCTVCGMYYLLFDPKKIDPMAPHGIKNNWDNCLVPYFHMADFFAKYGRKEPQALNHIPATFARGHPDKPFFEVLARDSAYFQRFSDGMATIEGMSPAVTAGMHDFSWLVQKAEQEPDRTVFVDVGGGLGQCILTIHQEFPGIPLDRCVLQERPEIIQVVEAAADPQMVRVQKVAMDFHVEQPNKGAMVYFIRRCLHNYSDTIAINILRVLAEAMADDSKILIQEDIKGAPPDTETAVLDFLMLTYGGKERTRQCWEDIVERAGLSIVAVSGGDGPWHGLFVIECVKKT
ncbi:hypothetical protein OQA88_9372 [Cercophora sp. LCS_1]